MKISPIFAKLLQLVAHGTLSSELFEFVRYLYPFQRYAKFSFYGFLTVHTYLKIYSHENYSDHRTFNADFRSVGVSKLSLNG